MEKHYNHKTIEPYWQDAWEQAGVFAGGDFSDQKKFYALDMFPYPSGAGLHVGHPEGYTATDIISRYKRMRGYNVLHPMGWDAFGLPAENYAIKAGVAPAQSTAENIKTFTRQIKSLGFSYDWNREVNTSSSQYYKWTQWLFLQLYKQGLAYKKKALVNWCEGCQTVLANEQVVDGKCERSGDEIVQKDLEQWFFKITDYAERLLDDLETVDWPQAIKLMQQNWIGKSEGAEIDFLVPKFDAIVFATNNPSKVARVKKLLEHMALPTELLTLEQVGINSVEVEEDGTLAENAEKKARAYHGKTNKPVLALDTGLFINGESQDPARVRRNALEGIDESKLSQEEIAEKMLGYYQEIARKNGGEVEGYWLDSWCLVLPDGSMQTSESKREIVLTDHVLSEVDIHLPVRSLYKVKVSGKPVAQQTEEEYFSKEMINITVSLSDLLCEKLRVFTTRPDTLYGATYMVVAPEHELVKQMLPQCRNQKEIAGYVQQAQKKTDLQRTDLNKEKTGAKIKGVSAINPATKELIPVFVADYVLASYGTGAIMAVPAHDERDFEFAKKFDVEIRVVIEPKAEGVEAEDRLKVYALGEAAYVGLGRLMNSQEFDGMDSETAKAAITKKVGGILKTQYRLRDWLVSRQRYWGAPIPIVYDPEGKPHPVKEDHLPLELPTDVEYKPKGTSPLGTSKAYVELAETLYGEGWRFEVDTMDTFVDSSWYFLRYCDANNTTTAFSSKKIDYWMPTDLYVGGAEHAVLHLLYARFFTKAFRDIGLLSINEPFAKLRNQGMILAEDGRKMSKSLGNVINPDDVVAEYGADTMRLYEMFMGPLEDTKPWSTKSIIGVRRFLEKVWLVTAEWIEAGKPDQVSDELNKLLHKTVKKVTADIEDMKFNTAISAMMILVNHMAKEKSFDQKFLEAVITILNPFAPHITEEIWSELGHKELLAKAAWPLWDEDLTIDDTISIGVQVNGKLRATIEVSVDAVQDDVLQLAKAQENVQTHIADKTVVKEIYVPGKIVNIVVKP